MKRTEVMKALRQVAKAKGVEMTVEEGGRHTKVLFDGQPVTTVPRHREINGYTAGSAIDAAEKWEA